MSSMVCWFCALAKSPFIGLQNSISFMGSQVWSSGSTAFFQESHMRGIPSRELRYPTRGKVKSSWKFLAKGYVSSHGGQSSTIISLNLCPYLFEMIQFDKYFQMAWLKPPTASGGVPTPSTTWRAIKPEPTSKTELLQRQPDVFFCWEVLPRTP